MKALSARSATWVFLMGIVVLAVLAFASDRSASRYADSESLVAHTREVETQLALLQADIARSSRRTYQDILLGDRQATAHQQANFADVHARLTAIQRLTADNPEQQHNYGKLRPLIEQRITMLKGLIASEGGPATKITPALHSDIATEGELATQVNALIRQMQDEEETLLNSRQHESSNKYLELRVVLAVALMVVVTFLLVAFRAVRTQLELRTTAEQTVRKLSRHVLRAQDEERRRLSRELHDSIGQLFAGLDMELASLGGSDALSQDDQQGLKRSRAIVAQGVSETRTISYLLHPPMLDEMGFEHAAKWYIEGFSERSKIQTDIDISQPFKRLTPDTELVLYRFIQEALTNVHRHSGSSRAQIGVNLSKHRVDAAVRDFGRGIRPDVLQVMQESSAGTGVGLGGMRERVAELGGELKLTSGPAGTTVAISIPLDSLRESTSDTDLQTSPIQKSPTKKTLAAGSDPAAGGMSLAIAI